MIKQYFLITLLGLSPSFVSAQTTPSTTTNANGGKILPANTNVQAKKKDPVYATPIKIEPATASTSAYVFDEKAFIDEYLIGTILPDGFPQFDTYTDKIAFQRDLKMWIYKNPGLIKEEKRIQ